MKFFILIGLITSSSLFAIDPVININPFTAKMQCQFNYDDAQGQFDGEVSVELIASAFDAIVAQVKVEQQCEDLKTEFRQKFNPDALY